MEEQSRRQPRMCHTLYTMSASAATLRHACSLLFGGWPVVLWPPHRAASTILWPDIWSEKTFVWNVTPILTERSHRLSYGYLVTYSSCPGHGGTQPSIHV